MDANIVKQARDMATPYALNLTAHDTSEQLCVQYVPDRGTGGAAATCQVTSATKLTFQVDAANPAGADVIGDASGDVAFATYTTVGALADYIRSKQAWRAILRGGLRADASASKLLTAAATSCFGDHGLSIFGDSSACEHVDICFSGEEFVSNAINGHVKDWPACENKIIHFDINLDMASDGTLTLYSGRQGETETIIYGPVTLTDATALQKGLEFTVGTFFKAAKRGERLILRAAHATDISTVMTQFQTLGLTAVLDGARIVNGDNRP